MTTILYRCERQPRDSNLSRLQAVCQRREVPLLDHRGAASAVQRANENRAGQGICFGDSQQVRDGCNEILVF